MFHQHQQHIQHQRFLCVQAQSALIDLSISQAFHMKLHLAQRFSSSSGIEMMLKVLLLLWLCVLVQYCIEWLINISWVLVPHCLPKREANKRCKNMRIIWERYINGKMTLFPRGTSTLEYYLIIIHGHDTGWYMMPWVRVIVCELRPSDSEGSSPFLWTSVSLSPVIHVQRQTATVEFKTEQGMRQWDNRMNRKKSASVAS